MTRQAFVKELDRVIKKGLRMGFLIQVQPKTIQVRFKKRSKTMDSKGNIYDQVDQEKKTARNIETGKTIKLTSDKSINLTEIPPEHVEKLRAMNRKDRRAWLAQYKKELAKVRAT